MPTLAHVLIYSCIGLFTTYILRISVLHIPHWFITYILHRPHLWRWVALVGDHKDKYVLICPEA